MRTVWVQVPLDPLKTLIENNKKIVEYKMETHDFLIKFSNPDNEQTRDMKFTGKGRDYTVALDDAMAQAKQAMKDSEWIAVVDDVK